MKTLWNSTNYSNDLRLTRADAASVTHPGPCDEDVKALMNKPYIKRQLKNINPIQLRKELYEYGAWNDVELDNHEDNLFRWLWISGNDITERK